MQTHKTEPKERDAEDDSDGVISLIQVSATLHLSGTKYYAEDEDDVVMMYDVHTAMNGFDKSPTSLLYEESRRTGDMMQEKIAKN